MNQISESWSKEIATSGPSSADSISYADEGSIIIAGNSDDLGDGIYLRKYSLDGIEEWTSTLGSNYGVYVKDIKSAQDGSIYISGSTQLSLDEQTHRGNNDAFLAKYDENGNRLWTRLWGTDGNDKALGIALNNNNSVFISGDTTGSIAGENSYGGFDSFITKYSSDGDQEWIRQYGSNLSDYSAGLGLDNSGFIYHAGSTQGDMGDQINAGILDVFLSKYSQEGDEIWTRFFGDKGNDHAQALVVGNNGEAYIAGTSTGDVDRDGYISAEETDAFLVKYGSEGIKEWTQVLASNEYDLASALTKDNDNNIYIAGYTQGDLLGVSEPKSDSLFIGKYNIDGELMSIQNFQYDYPRDIVAGDAGSIYIAAAFKHNDAALIKITDPEAEFSLANDTSKDLSISEQFVDNISLDFDILLINNEDTSISHPVSIRFEEANQASMGDLIDLGRDGQPVISKSGDHIAIGLDNALLIKGVGDNSSKVVQLGEARAYGNYQIEAISNDGGKVYLRTWNSFNPAEKIDDQIDSMNSGGSGFYEIQISETDEIDSVQRLDVDQNGDTFTYQGWSPEHGDFDLSGDERSIVFAIRDTADSVTWGNQQVKVYKKNLSSGEISRIDQPILSESLGYSSRPRINFDGSKVLFESSLDLTEELGAADSSRGNNIYLWDESSGFTLVNKTAEGSIIESQYGWHANFDQEGRKIVFQTGEALAAEDINSISDVYIKDLESGAINLISNQTVVKQEPGGGEFESQIGGIYPRISPGGKFVYYQKYDFHTDGSYLFAFDVETGLSSEIPGVDNTNLPNFNSENVEAISSEGALIWTWKDYASSDTDSDADYYFIRHEYDGFEWATNSLGISYQLNGSALQSPLSQLAVLGDAVNESTNFQLSVFAESLLTDHIVESTDLTIDFDPRLFGEINVSDITIGGALPIANAIQVDNETGTIRIAAASLSDLNQGSGISANTLMASINLDFDEEQIKLLDKNEDGSLKINPLAFQITANDQETVFSKTFTDDSGLANREIITLAGLGGGLEVTGQDVTLYEAKVNLAQQGDGLVLGTKRVIGSDATTTNLVRSGDTLTTSTEWLNVGNTQANNLSYVGLYNQNASLTNADFSKSSIASGSFIDGVFIKDARESTVLTTDIKITGQAGNVVDLGDGIISVQADAEGSDSFSNAGKGSSNLITYQGDLNYDGRVSMKDLAYLNAGAARQELVDGTDENGNAVQVASTASYARDVDADFSGKIDLADLAVLDNDWGKTLHNGDEGFQGSADVSWSDLDAQGSSSSWDNSSFKDQNSIEAESTYVGSLESPAATGVIGADGNNSANDGDMQGTELQDPLSA